MKAIGMLVCPLSLGIVMSVAMADQQGSDRELVLNLFEQGVQKVRDGKCDATPVGDLERCREARDLFTRVYSLDPDALGALRNLSQLEQNLGLLASASRHYRDLARKAPFDPKPARRAWAEAAKSSLAALQPRVPHLTVVLGAPPAGTQVKLDDDVMPEPAWGAPIEVDPGRHTISAQAPNHVAFEVRVDVGEGDNRTVRVELLPLARPVVVASEPPKEVVPPPVPPPVASPQPTTPEPAPASPPEPSLPDRPAWSRFAPWVVVGGGGLVMGAGAAFGIAAINQRSTACPNGGNICDPGEYEKGLGWADTSTALFAVGGAAVAGGLIWHFVTPSKSQQSHATPRSSSIQPIVGPTAVGVQGCFE